MLNVSFAFVQWEKTHKSSLFLMPFTLNTLSGGARVTSQWVMGEDWKCCLLKSLLNGTTDTTPETSYPPCIWHASMCAHVSAESKLRPLLLFLPGCNPSPPPPFPPPLLQLLLSYCCCHARACMHACVCTSVVNILRRLLWTSRDFLCVSGDLGSWGLSNTCRRSEVGGGGSEVRVGGWLTKEGTDGCRSWRWVSCPSWTDDWPAVLPVIFQFSEHKQSHFYSSEGILFF